MPLLISTLLYDWPGWVSDQKSILDYTTKETLQNIIFQIKHTKWEELAQKTMNNHLISSKSISQIVFV